MKLLKIILNLLLSLLVAGGFVCAVILAIIAKAWIPLVAILALGWAAYPTVKGWVKDMMPKEGDGN